MTDSKTFYDRIRPLFGRITGKQLQGMECIFFEWHKRGLTDLRWLAYMFGTIFWETAKTMQPIEEYGKGKGYKYGKKIKRSGVPYTKPDKIFYGRGHVMLTWFENYENMGRLLGIDLLNKPELMLNADVSIQVMFEGMTKGASSFGDFTGKCLEMYFNEDTEDWINARRIINGTDKSKTIADISKKVYNALI